MKTVCYLFCMKNHLEMIELWGWHCLRKRQNKLNFVQVNDVHYFFHYDRGHVIHFGRKLQNLDCGPLFFSDNPQAHGA